jgi:hypothetical protein
LDPGKYFYYVFRSLTNPDHPKEAAYFGNVYAKMNKLNEGDVSLLQASATEFVAAAAQVYAGLRLGARDEDGQTTHACNVVFLDQVQNIGSHLMAALSPDAAGRIRASMGAAGSVTPKPTDADLTQCASSLPAAEATEQTGRLSPQDLTLPSQFTQCICPPGTSKCTSASTCPLAAGTYDINGSSTYPIVWAGRSSITVEGSADPNNPTILERTAPYPTQIAGVVQGFSNVTFSWLSFLGNAATMPAGSYNGNYFDLDLEEGSLTGSLEYDGVEYCSPFSCTPEYVKYTSVENCTFYFPPAIAVYTNYDSNVNGNWFYFDYESSCNCNGTAAIWAWSNFPWDPQSTGIQFENNQVYNSGGGAVGLNGASSVTIQGNVIAGSNLFNHFGGGGQIGVTEQFPTYTGTGWSGPQTVTYVPQSVTVANNNLNGEGPYGTVVPNSYGTELWGDGYTISGNTIENHALVGLLTFDMSSGNITGNTIENNGGDGIQLQDTTTPLGSNPAPQCPPAANPLFQITSNTIENNNSYAVEGIMNKCTSPNTYPNANDIVFSGNTISGNKYNTEYYH